MTHIYYKLWLMSRIPNKRCQIEAADLQIQQQRMQKMSQDPKIQQIQSHIQSLSGSSKYIKLLQRLNKKSPRSYHIMWRLCKVYEQMGNYQMSAKYFSKIVKIYPDNRWHFNRRIRYLIETGKYKQALYLFEKSPLDIQDQQKFYLEFGLKMLRKSRFSSAILSFKEVLLKNRYHEVALYSLARAYFFQNQIKLGIQAIQTCILINPTYFEYDVMHRMLIITKNLQEDRPIQFNQRVDDEQCNYKCFLYFAQICYLKKDFQKARDYFSKYSIEDCQCLYEKSHTLNRLTDSLRMTKDYELANYFFQQYKILFPPMAHFFNLGIAINLVDLNKVKQAKKMLIFCQQQMKKASLNYYFRLYFGLCLKLKKYQQCADKYQQHKVLLQNLPRIHFNIIYSVSTSYMQLGMQLKAKEFLKMIFESKYKSLTKSLTEDNFCQLVKYYIMNNLVDQAKDLLFTVKRMCENWENFYRSRYIKQTRKCILEIEKSLPK